MGAAESVISQFTGEDEDNKKAQDLVKQIYAEAEAENDAFFESVLYSNIESQRVIPISAVLSKKSWIKVCTLEDSQALAKEGVGNLVESIANSNIGGAISGLVNTAITALLINKSMSYSRKVGYSISIGKLGGVERIDYIITKRSFTSKGWKNKMQDVMSGMIVISACDIKGLKPNDAAVLVQNCFKNNSLRIQAGIKQLLTISLNSSLTLKEIREKQAALLPDLKRRFNEQAELEKKQREEEAKKIAEREAALVKKDDQAPEKPTERPKRAILPTSGGREVHQCQNKGCSALGKAIGDVLTPLRNTLIH